ncbi:MAG: YcnI family protein, partial [Proteobacteria bacterium]|nr:YcnI family protein [Pseudomonadota bacterium]
MSKNILAAACAVALLSLSAPALAHVTLEQGQAVAGSTYKAVIRVPHGCAGSPTTAVRVKIPDGMTGVKPMPKAGWVVKTETGPYARDHRLNGQTVSSGVRAIVWSGGDLGDDQYDEFVFQARITDAVPVGRLHVPVI